MCSVKLLYLLDVPVCSGGEGWAGIVIFGWQRWLLAASSCSSSLRAQKITLLVDVLLFNSFRLSIENLPWGKLPFWCQMAKYTQPLWDSGSCRCVWTGLKLSLELGFSELNSGSGLWEKPYGLLRFSYNQTLGLVGRKTDVQANVSFYFQSYFWPF